MIDPCRIKMNKNKRDKVKKYILDINNKLTELADFLFLDIKDELNNPTIQKIKVSQKNPPFDDIKFGDIAKKAIVDVVLNEEREEALRKAAIKAAGITVKELTKTADEFEKETKGTPPPKIDWKRESLDRSEKDKILKSLRANPKSNIFSKEFRWDIKEFLNPFNYLESSDNYSGQFIVSVVDDKKELEKYSKIENLNKGIHEIYFGKYVLVSMYDITASNGDPNESKYIYMGLKFVGFSGRLEFDCLGSVDGKISNDQKLSVKEYLDAMQIIYDEDNRYLKASL